MQTDADWVRYWVQAKNDAENQAGQLTGYMTTIVKKPIGSAQPSEPTWELPRNPPPAVAPGIRKRIRNIVAAIKGQKAIYDPADGELLGIVGAKKDAPDAATLKPLFDIRTLPAFNLETEFQKKRMDALRVEIKYANSDTWTTAATLTNSPGIFPVAPTTPGRAEQIEVRAIYLRKNQPVGNYSDIVTAFVAP